MALISTEKITHRVLYVRGGGQAATVLEGGGDAWLVEPGKTNVRQIYNTVVEQLARQGYKIISIADGTTTLQLESSGESDNAEETSLYLLERLEEGDSLRESGARQTGAVTLERNPDASLLASHGLPNVSSEQASSIVRALRAGQVIQAIKEIRLADRSLGLKEAKDLAETLQGALGISKPNQSHGGCLALLAFIAVGVSFFTWFAAHWNG